MSQPIEFDTARLRLRQWLPSDRQPFAKMSADPKVMEFFPALMDRQTSDTMADRCQALIAERGWGLWVAERKDDAQFIGFVGLHIPTVDLPFNPCVEIGWRIAAEFWRQGYATEAALGALAVGFERLELPEIVSFTALINHRSQAVMERLGMRRSSEHFIHPAVDVNSPLAKHCLYNLSREQWIRACNAKRSNGDDDQGSLGKAYSMI